MDSHAVINHPRFRLVDINQETPNVHYIGNLANYKTIIPAPAIPATNK